MKLKQMTSLQFLDFLFKEPKVLNESQKLSAQFIHYSTIVVGISDIIVAFTFIATGEFIATRPALMAVVLFTCIICRFLLHKNRIFLAGQILSFFLWAVVVAAAVIRGGLRNPAFVIIFAFIPMTFLINGRKTALIYSIVDVIAIFLLLYVRPSIGMLENPEYSLLFIAIIYIITIAFTIVFFNFSDSLLQSSQSKIMDLQQQLYQTQKMEALGRFAGGIAHDFNNILTAIIGHTELLSVDPDNSKEHIANVATAVAQAKEITTQLLTLSKKQLVNSIVVILNDEITHMQSILRTLIPENIKINYNYDKNLLPIFVDPILIRQIILNLVTNSRDSIDGNGTITLSTSVNVIDNKKHSSLIVSDTGSGIPDEILVKIFDPFFSTKDKTRGTGLGLSIVYSIVTSIDGKIDVTSEITEGTTFKVHIPSYEGKMPLIMNEKDKVETKTSINLSRKKIMLVEDDDLLLPYLDNLLRLLGAEVVALSDPMEALDIYSNQNNSFDLIITDIVLPGIDGIRLVKELVKFKKDIKVLLISGYPESNLLDEFKVELKYPFLQKPFGQEQLIEKLRVILDI